MKSSLLISKLGAAKLELSKAEVALAGAIRDIRTAPRSNKTVVTVALDDALEKVGKARSALAELNTLIREAVY